MIQNDFCLEPLPVIISRKRKNKLYWYIDQCLFITSGLVPVQSCPVQTNAVQCSVVRCSLQGSASAGGLAASPAGRRATCESRTGPVPAPGRLPSAPTWPGAGGPGPWSQRRPRGRTSWPARPAPAPGCCAAQSLPADPDGRPQDQEAVDLVLSRELPDLLPDAVRRCAGRPEGGEERGVRRAVCLDVSAGGCGSLDPACLLFKVKERCEVSGIPTVDGKLSPRSRTS